MRTPIVVWIFSVGLILLATAHTRAEWVENGTPILAMEWEIDDPVDIVSDLSGGAIIAYVNNCMDGYCSAVGVQNVDVGGVLQWGPYGIWLCSALHVTWQQMISDGAGGAFVVQTVFSEVINPPLPDPPHLCGDRVFADGTRIPLSFSLYDYEQQYQYQPDLAPDGGGGVIITWSERRDTSSTAANIRAQRTNGNGIAQWDSLGVALCSAAGNQKLPRIASDGVGGAIVVWEDDRVGDFYSQRIDADGKNLWVTDGVPVCSTAGTRAVHQIISDDLGGVIIVWQDGLKWHRDIFAQRLDPDGNRLWGGNGVAVCDEDGDQEDPFLIPDGDNGAIIIWGDLRNGQYDVFAQRIDSAGMTMWAPAGVAICAEEGDQDSHQIATDDVGGAIIAWTDARGASKDIYAQRINGTGSVQWDVDGVPVCTDPANQLDAVLAEDGANGAVIAWSDWRNRSGWDSDVYAMRITGSGVPVGIELPSDGMPIPDVILRQNHPNPFNPATTISFALANRAKASLCVYNLEGKLVATLVDDTLDGGFKEATWDGKDASGNEVSAGVYFYRLTAGNQTLTKKMVLLK